MKKLLFFIPFLILVWGCNEELEGCLDPEASNFDPSADISCCCEYPQLQIRFDYDNLSGDSTAFTLNTNYLDGANNNFLITQFSMYLTDFELVKDDNSVVRIEDELEVTSMTGDKILFIDDIILLQPNVFQFDVGRLQNSGTFKQIKFKIGLTEEQSRTNPDSVATTHPLYIDNALYSSFISDYNNYAITVVKDTSNLNQLDNFNLSGTPLEITLDYDFVVQSGFNTTLNLNADLKKVFDNVDFQNDTNEVIANSIFNNVNTIFSVVE